ILEMQNFPQWGMMYSRVYGSPPGECESKKPLQARFQLESSGFLAFTGLKKNRMQVEPPR
ncbi:MAG: hypothetical protein EAZ68_21040, partial [Oscillatoriales cyanobacterium]